LPSGHSTHVTNVSNRIDVNYGSLLFIHRRKEIGRQILTKPVVSAKGKKAQLLMSPVRNINDSESILHDIFDGRPLHGIHLQHVQEEIDHRLVQVIRDGKDSR